MLNKKTEQIVAVTCTYRIAILMIGPPLALHLLLPRIISNDQNIPPRFRQAITTALGHIRDCKVPFEYSCKQLCHIEKIFYLTKAVQTGSETVLLNLNLSSAPEQAVYTKASS